jgi:predicted metal-binding membrane protein
MMNERTSQRAFLATSALLFIGSAALTTAWCSSMAQMGGMPMPGGWTMSMTWMRMPEQSWAEATASFIGMWVVMMAAMMMPSLVPALWRYREFVRGTGKRHLALHTALAGLGYFFVWTVIGLAVFALGVALAGLEMDSPALARTIPFMTGVVVLIAGTLQFTRWKKDHLSCWRDTPHDCAPAANAGTSWRYGLRLGIRCSYGCASLTAALLAVGVMDLKAMASVMAAISAERLAPGGDRVAKAVGAVVTGVGALLIARAAGLR